MVLKKDSWLVRGVLILAVAAFAAVPILMSFNGRSGGESVASNTAVSAEDQTAKLKNAVQGFNAVLEREPDNQTALTGLIDAKLQLGDLEGAVEPLERLVKVNPNPEYAIALAQTKQQLKDLEGAAQVYRQVLTQAPGNVAALEGLVALLIDQQRPEAAVGLLKDTLATADQTNELAPGSVDKLSVKLLLAQVFVEQQKDDEALKLYDEAIADAKAASPAQPDFRPTLAKALILQQRGDTTTASALFEEALAMAPVQYKDGVRQLIAQRTAPASAGQPAPAEGKSADGSTPGSQPAANPSAAEGAPAAAPEEAPAAPPAQ